MQSHTPSHTGPGSPAEHAKSPRHWIRSWVYMPRIGRWHVTSTTVVAGVSIPLEARAAELADALADVKGKEAAFERLDAAGGEL